ncbi:MAG: SCO family protein [Bacteroidetes Order II. Incertae sedis bacterium]|nr:SCO family protein [Bacteroidetes Order II. bacterium]
MKKTLLLGILLAVGVAVLLYFLMTLEDNEGKTYATKGKITGFGDVGVVFIEHETIPEVMESMTMPFTVRSPELLKGLETGDAISFIFHMTETDSWITDIKKIRPEDLNLPSAAPKAEIPDNVKILQAGDQIPEVTLINQDGKDFALDSFSPKILVTTFIYTNCPDPTLCPRMSDQFRQLQTKINASKQTDVHLLTISFDPKRDTPEKLKAYANRYTKSFTNWSFATGSPEAIGKTIGAFGVTIRDEGGNLIEHNLSTAVISPTGKVVKIFRGNTWTPDEVLEAINIARS